MLASMTGLVKQTNAQIVTSLEKEAPALTELQKRFSTLLANRRDAGEEMEIICCHEELPVLMLGMVRHGPRTAIL
jgi:hypothetical protein